MHQAGAATKKIAFEFSNKAISGNSQRLMAMQGVAEKIATFLSQTPNSALVN
jgi:hypothetical protein